MMNFDDRQWRVDELLELVVEEDVRHIVCLPIPRSPTMDTLIWDASVFGNFAVKSAYSVARRVLGFDITINTDCRLLWSRVWSASVPPKVRYFAWRLLWNLLPLKTNLQKRGMEIDGVCVVCNSHAEALGHVFFTCPFSHRVWEIAAPWVICCVEQWSGLEDFWMRIVAKAVSVGQLDIFLVLLWSL
ncbi:hypothetical protein COLO4_20039 [Corchorus olitorius]|uniref:Reverse transcriptase zinc-binding domain-containing protein n=1 Tax=Corchorus olitorius TaxID=93759 RepID=A0A1R3J206_9ROSI|nr:hypothetical protein COLO4_20039 [Corchorus olitorius]